jgi:hypothetical protein
MKKQKIKKKKKKKKKKNKKKEKLKYTKSLPRRMTSNNKRII